MKSPEKGQRQLPGLKAVQAEWNVTWEEGGDTLNMESVHERRGAGQIIGEHWSGWR